MSTVPNADPEAVLRFVKSDTPTVPPGTSESDERKQLSMPDTNSEHSRRRRGRAKPTGVTPVGLIPVTVRLRPHVAGALKRASLERQLAGEVVFTQQELVEEALEPWLRSNGYLD